ncbi:protein apterous-like isoform X1 [Spodoptera litura]|uniref:Protein apterous-like isoform X1 n=1 Tax=Spodoptera litura TaxID=69820 RepID=A0A9J7EJY5_SPOLT|nr:protein apterous-like isoform X1 [Spodoptera litura]
MGVYEERGTMHWQQSERYLTSAYEGGGDLSPVAPATSPGSPRDCTSCRKREPPDETPQPPPEDACAGCGGRITDRYYLLALERRWHTPCLKCCECKMPLDSEQRCYARDSNIFCKNDYFRLYGSKRCARCNTPISASELVMRARDLVFHVHCFSCALCSTPLNKGDTFGIRDSAVYCRLHYETMPDYGAHMAVPGPPQMCPVPYATGPAPGPHYPPYPSPEFARVDNDVPKGPFFNGSTAPPPRQKGRPRKKKPKDQELMAANLGLVPECPGQVEEDGDKAGEQALRQMLPRCFSRYGPIPWSNGVDSVVATSQPTLQRNGRPTEPELHGLPLAFIKRLMSAINLNPCGTPSRTMRRGVPAASYKANFITTTTIKTENKNNRQSKQTCIRTTCSSNLFPSTIYSKSVSSRNITVSEIRAI